MANGASGIFKGSLACARLFVGSCATCHGNGKVGRGNPDGYVHIILNGARRDDDPSAVTMPSLARILDDVEIVTLANYLVERVGGTPGSVTPQQVAARRSEVGLPPAP